MFSSQVRSDQSNMLLQPEALFLSRISLKKKNCCNREQRKGAFHPKLHLLQSNILVLLIVWQPVGESDFARTFSCGNGEGSRRR